MSKYLPEEAVKFHRTLQNHFVEQLTPLKEEIKEKTGRSIEYSAYADALQALYIWLGSSHSH